MRSLRFFTNILLTALSSVLLGCAPYINTYYLPEAQAGYRDTHSTLTTDAPIWVLEREDATFYFSARKARAGQTVFKLVIEPIHLPGETSLSAKVREEAKAAAKPITVGLKHIQGGAMISFLETTARAELARVVSGTYGVNRRRSIETLDSDVRLSADQFLELSMVFSNADHSEFLVEWPTIVINQKPVVLPPINFKWKRGVQVQFING